MTERTAKLEQAHLELTRSNTDLEQLAYAASHDLQEPLRHVVSYSQLLNKQFRGQLGPEGDDYLQFIVAGGKRMSDLIKGLLNYSRLGRAEHRFEPQACQLALTDALNHLQLQLEDTGGAVQADLLPTVVGNGPMLTQLFYQLMENAFKFRSAAPPRIHITARPAGHRWRAAVGVERARQWPGH